MSCRLITSPITGKEETSKTWNDIRQSVKTDEEADKYYDQLLSNEFISWFGDWVNEPNGVNTSKVVNDLGEPLVVYHGAGESFEEFNFKTIIGINYFTPNKKYAESYAMRNFKNAKRNKKSFPEIFKNINPEKTLFPVFLNIKNPQIESNISNENIDNGFLELKQGYDGLAGTDVSIFGIDGVQYDNPEVYGTYYANQIKAIKNNGNFSKSKNIYNSLEGTEGSKASAKTVEKVKEFLKRIGVEIKDLDTARYNGVNGVAQLLENIIQLAQGKEAVALPEEAMHFAVEILKQTNSPLYTQMMNKIGSYNIYKDVLATYGVNPKYQKNGKPDIIKLKEEAIGKVLAEYFIKSEEGVTEKPELLKQTQSWIDWLKTAIQKLLSKAQFNPFEEAVAKVKEGNLSSNETAKNLAERINLSTLGKGMFSSMVRMGIENKDYITTMSMLKDQLSDPNSYEQTLKVLGGDVELAQDIINSELYSIASNKAVDDLYNKYIEEDKNIVLHGQNTNDRHYTYKGERVAQSVTEKISKEDKQWGEQTPEQIKRTEETGKWGTAGHDYIEKFITANLIDSNGYALPTPLKNPIQSPLAPALQEKLAQYITSLVKSYPQGTRFLVEKKVINTKDKGMTASTIDFLAIIPGANNTIEKVDTLDWKFFNLNKDKDNDIPWYKNKKWNKQMSEYTAINRQYGVKSTQIGKARMVPFITNYTYATKGDAKTALVLNSLEIGKLDSTQETELYLLPVPANEESTGFKRVDELITRLRDQYEKLWNKRVDEKDKGDKNTQLNELAKAIRQLHLQINFDPLQKEAKTFLLNAQKVLDKYKSTDFSKLSKQEINNILQELLELQDSANIYEDVNESFLEVFPKDSQTKEEKEKSKFFDALAQSTGRLIENIRNVQIRAAAGLAVQENTLFTEDVDVAASKIITAEKEITTMAETFTEASKLPSKVIQLASKLWINKKSEQYQEEKALGNRFATLLSTFLDATKSFKNALDAIKQKDKHKLIFKVDPQFYEDIEKATEDKNKKFLLANVNLEEYNKAIEEKIKESTDNIMNTTYNEDLETNLAEQEVKIEKLKDSLQLASDDFNGYHSPVFQYYYKKFAKIEDHLSSEYKEMAKSPAILAMWKFLTELNIMGKESGYINSQAFLPFIEGTILEQIRQSSNTGKTIKELLKQGYILNVNEQASHVKINKQTGEVEKSIAKLFTRKSDSIEDSAYSQDIVKLVGPWINAMLSYQSAIEMESIMLTLLEVEQSKGHLQIDPATKKVIFEHDTPKEFNGNEKNAAILQKIVDDNIYHIQENSNTFVDIATDKFSKGTEEEKTRKKLQTKKILQNTNKWTAMLATGGKLMVSIPNFIGNEFQALINAGNFYRGKEYFTNSIAITGSGGRSLSTIDKGLIDIIHPLNEDTQLENTRKFAGKQSTASWLNTWSINDIMHSANRIGELVHEYTNAKTWNDNSMVVDGKIVNIRQYLKKQDSSKYNQSQEERAALEKSFEQRVKDLKESKSLPKIAEFKDGVLTIPGVSKEELAKYRTTVAEYARNISGKVSRDNKAEWNRSVILRSFMMFKGWIPKQLDLRTSGIRYNNELSSWEYGRTRLFIKTLAHLGRSRIFEMREIIKGTDKGLAIMREILEEKRQKYYEATGQELEITDEEFFDMMRKELHSQSKELTMLVGVVSFFIASKAAQPDKDDDVLVQNRYKWWRKLLNKISNELDFYYNPTSADSITRGSILPSLSILNKVEKAFQQLEEEARGHIIGDDKLIEDKHPLKYFLNLIPGPAQFQNEILPVIAPELAKEMGIRVTEQARQGQ